MSTSDELWQRVYHGPAAGWDLHGTCAACEYQGPVDDFRVWHRGARVKVLCNQCSSDVHRTLLHEHWEREQ